MSKVELEKIVLKIGGKEIELSLEEAEGLKKVLDNLFHINTPYPIYTPIYIEREPYRTPWRINDVWYGNTTGSTLCLSTNIKDFGG